MNRCPITYELCGKDRYSTKGLRLLSKKLTTLNDFPYTSKEQIQLASRLASKLSIQGVQPKLSIILNVAEAGFQVVEKNGTFIMKPPHQLYEEVPENEDLTMHLAQLTGIESPLHGMAYNIDNTLSYFIQRFDRKPRNQKIAVEDFSQLLGFSRETKYDASMEKVISVIEKHCTFPLVEKFKLFRRTLFNFLTGNEDMHLKNFSLIRHNHKVELSPAYDLLNTTIIIKATEEIALPIRGKKSHLKYDDLFNYFGKIRLGLQDKILVEEMDHFKNILPIWKTIIQQSFLSLSNQNLYMNLIDKRWQQIQ